MKASQFLVSTLKEAPADAEAQDDPAARELIDVGDLVGEDDGLAERRQQRCSAADSAARVARGDQRSHGKIRARRSADCLSASRSRMVP